MSSTGRIYTAVALGSGLGAAARYGVSLALLQAGAPSFPWATLIVNVTGSFAVGFVYASMGPAGRILARWVTRQFLIAGFCGGLTTFSVFSLETVMLAIEGRSPLATANVVLSLLLWVPSAGAGYAFADHFDLLRPVTPRRDR